MKCTRLLFCMLALIATSIDHAIEQSHKTPQPFYSAQQAEPHYSANSHVAEKIRATLHAQKYTIRNHSFWLIATPVTIVCMYGFFGCSALPDIRLAFATTIIWLIANIRTAYEIDAITTNTAHQIDNQLVDIDKEIDG